MALQIKHQEGINVCNDKMLQLEQKINTTGTCQVFALFVHTLCFSATIVFDIDTVQMHNSTTDTIKDTY